MKFVIQTSQGTPIERDITEPLQEKVRAKLRIVSTRGEVAEAIRVSLDELEAEVKAKTIALGPEHI